MVEPFSPRVLPPSQWAGTTAKTAQQLNVLPFSTLFHSPFHHPDSDIQFKNNQADWGGVFSIADSIKLAIGRQVHPITYADCLISAKKRLLFFSPFYFPFITPLTTPTTTTVGQPSQATPLRNEAGSSTRLALCRFLLVTMPLFRATQLRRVGQSAWQRATSTSEVAPPS